MINQFPSPERPYSQINRGDSIGGFWATKNIDLQSNYGVMRLAPRMLLGASVATDATFTLLNTVKEFDGRLWALAGAKIYKNNTTEPNEAWAADDSTGFVETYDEIDSDLEVFNNKLYASNGAGLYQKASNGSGTGSWSVATATPNAGILQYFRKFNRLYISEANNSIQSIDTANTYAGSGDYTITLPSSYDILCMCETTDSIWIGTINGENLAGKGSIFRWDGVSPQATDRYYLSGGNEIVSLTVRGDVPYAMDSLGILYEFTGTTFKEVGRFPFTDTVPMRTSTGSSNERYIHRHGMAVSKNDTILIHTSNLYSTNNYDMAPENMSAGIWEWSEDFGMIHKYSVGYTPRESTTITDWGQTNFFLPGALYTVPIGQDTSDANGTLICGANYYVDNDTSSSTSFGLFYDDSNDLLQKKGYFVTTWFDSIEIQDKWERLWAVYKQLLNSSDSIVFKYRVTETDPVVANITWVNTTSFTTTTNITTYSPLASGFNGTQGGEVEIIQGVGSGLCAHITSITELAGTYTVTIDETATGATTTTARARFQKWIKLNPSEAINQIKQYSQYAIGASSPGIQIKCCMTFTGADEFIKMGLVSNEDITLSK